MNEFLYYKIIMYLYIYNMILDTLVIEPTMVGESIMIEIEPIIIDINYNKL